MADKPANPNAQLEAMILALANVSAIEQVMNHAQARHHVEELRERIAAVVAKTRLELREAEQRKQIAGEIDKLVDTIARIQNDVGRAVAGSSDRLKAATRAKTLDGMAQALRLISDWLGNPTAEKQAQVEQLIANLRALTGADPFLDDTKAEAKLHAEIEADVKKSLGEIFDGSRLSRLCDHELDARAILQQLDERGHLELGRTHGLGPHVVAGFLLAERDAAAKPAVEDSDALDLREVLNERPLDLARPRGELLIERLGGRRRARDQRVDRFGGERSPMKVVLVRVAPVV